MKVKKTICPNCGERAAAEAEFCGNCGQHLLEEDHESDKVYDDSVLYLCPVCDKRNKIKDTFRCPSCETEYLCHEHRVKKSKKDPATGEFRAFFYCTNCWKQDGFATFSE